MQVWEFYSKSKRVFFRGNAENDYVVYRVVDGMTLRVIGAAFDNWRPRQRGGWRFWAVGDTKPTFTARTLSELVAKIEAKFGS